MSVGDDFQTFRGRYVIGAQRIADISYRYKRITRQLNTDFRGSYSDTANSWYVGSYGRDTAAINVSDLDVAYLLPSSVYFQYHAHAGNGQSALLQAVRRSIATTYPSTAVSGDGQVVVTTFTDGIKFEILPVFDNDIGTWTFPDSNNGGSWRTCNPRAEMTAVNVESASSNRNLKHLSRMMRLWKSYWSVPISGMLIDTLAYNFMRTWTHKAGGYSYHDWMVRDFLRYLAQCESSQTYWRAPGSGSSVWRTGSFETSARKSLVIAEQAVANDVQGQVWSRRQRWREIFGSTYPDA